MNEGKSTIRDDAKSAFVSDLDCNTREASLDRIARRMGASQMRSLIASALEHHSDDIVLMLSRSAFSIIDEVLTGDLRGLPLSPDDVCNLAIITTKLNERRGAWKGLNHFRKREMQRITSKSGAIEPTAAPGANNFELKTVGEALAAMTGGAWFGGEQ